MITRRCGGFQSENILLSYPFVPHISFFFSFPLGSHSVCIAGSRLPHPNSCERLSRCPLLRQIFSFYRLGSSSHRRGVYGMYGIFSSIDFLLKRVVWPNHSVCFGTSSHTVSYFPFFLSSLPSMSHSTPRHFRVIHFSRPPANMTNDTHEIGRAHV